MSSNTALIASAIKGATESTSTLSVCIFSGSGSVSVTMIFSIGDEESLSDAGPEKTPWFSSSLIC